MITEPGIYTIPLSEYIKDPAPRPSLNASVAQVLLEQSPKHAWLAHPRLGNGAREESSRADLGTIAHGLLLEDDKSRVVVIQADDWRKKVTQEARDEAYAAGKVPILEKDMETVNRMVEAADHCLMGSELCNDWLDATPEQTLIWKDGATWFRSRPDKLSKDGRVYFDYKTTGSANPMAFTKVAIRQGYDLQAALGQRGVEAIKGVETIVIFVVQEIDAPYAVSLVSLSPQFMDIADNRLEMARRVWDQCHTKKEWPGYSDRVAYVDPPGYYGMDQLDVEVT